MNYSDLKIQFRAVSYAKSTHVLEYRVDPDQDLIYEKIIGFWIFKFKVKRKYNTNWHQPRHFWNHITAKYYTEDDDYNYGPFWIENQKSLDWYKNNFKTIGEFINYINEYSNKEYEAWKIERANWLKEQETMY